MENNIPASEWEWENLMEDPSHRQAADHRAACRAACSVKAEEEKRVFLRNFYEDREAHRKNRIQILAARYGIGALASGTAAYFCAAGGIEWLAWVSCAAAATLALIASYGFGRAREI